MCCISFIVFITVSSTGYSACPSQGFPVSVCRIPPPINGTNWSWSYSALATSSQWQSLLFSSNTVSYNEETKQTKNQNKQKKQKTHNHTTNWQIGAVLLKYTNWFSRIIYFQIIFTGQILFNYFRMYSIYRCFTGHILKHV